MKALFMSLPDGIEWAMAAMHNILKKEVGLRNLPPSSSQEENSQVVKCDDFWLAGQKKVTRKWVFMTDRVTSKTVTWPFIITCHTIHLFFHSPVLVAIPFVAGTGPARTFSVAKYYLIWFLSHKIFSVSLRVSKLETCNKGLAYKALLISWTYGIEWAMHNNLNKKVHNFPQVLHKLWNALTLTVSPQRL